MRKLTYQYVKNLFLNNNMELLSTDYQNTQQKLKYICLKCKYEGVKTFGNLSQGKGCPSCAGILKYTYEEAKYFFFKKDMKLLSKEYKNNLQKLKYKCLKCGYIGTKALGSLLSGNLCPSCAGVLKYTYKQVEQLFLDKNIKLLSKNYKNIKQRLKYKCLNCGYVGTKALKNLKDTFGCNKCGAKKGQNKTRYTYSEVKLLFLKKGLELLSKKYENYQQRLKYKCLKCGYKGKKSLGHLDHSCNWYKMELTEEDRMNRRNISEYKEWARNIKKKYKYTCQKCNIMGGRLHSHHKNGWNNFPDQRYLISNGIVLCKCCHIKFHSIYGKGNNVSSQTNAFLK